jgi:large subunit ribosomal protein L25
MDRVKLVVSERTETGTRAVKRLRRQNLIPGVLYSAGRDAVSFTIPAHDLREAMTTGAGRHAVLDVVFEGHKRAHAAVIKDMQLDVVKRTITHIDLHEIQLDEPIDTKVSVQLEGTPAGVKEGGVLEMVSHEISVRGLPADIPEHVTVNVDELAVGQGVRIKDLVLPEGLTALDDPDETLVHVVQPRAEEVEPEAVEEAAAEPGVAGKGEEQGAEE